MLPTRPMRDFSKRIFIVVLSTSLASSAWSAPFCSEEFPVELNDTQAQALQIARQSDYQVSVLSGMIGGRSRQVIFLGETHVKDSAAQKVGLETARHFPFRGIEGASTEVTWGGRFLSWTVDVAYKLGNLFSFGKRNQESTIDDLLRVEDLREAMATIEARREKGVLDEKDLSSMTFQVGKRSLTYPQIMKELESLVGDPKALPAATHLPLEEGHKPDLAENIQSVLLPATVLSCVGAFCSAALEYVVPGNQIVASVRNVSTAIIAFNGFQMFGSQFLGRWYKDKKWYKNIFSVQFGLLNARNKTMAQNIQAAFEKYQDQSTILVIVGKEHIEGIKEILTRKLGFKESLVSTPSSI